MATKTFRNKQELQDWLAQNKGVQGSADFGDGNTVDFGQLRPKEQPRERNFLESLVGSFVDPFIGLGKKGLEAGNALSQNKFGDFVKGENNYKTAFLNDEEYQNFKNNPFLDTGKDILGVGANFVPVGKIGMGLKGIGQLAKAGAISGGLSSLANQDPTNEKGFGGIDLVKAGADGLVGGAFGAGLGVVGKGLGALRKNSKNIANVGLDVKAKNLNLQFDKNTPIEWTQGYGRDAVKSLQNSGKATNPFNLQQKTQTNSSDFKNLLSDKYKDTVVDFAGNAQNNLDNLISPQALDKNINIGQIKNALRNNPDLANFSSGIASLEDQIKAMNSGALGKKIGQVRSTLNAGRDATKIKGLDNLANELEQIVPGYGIGDSTDPASAIENFLEVKDKFKNDLANIYKLTHEGLLNIDPKYAQSFGTKVPSLGISDTRKTIADEIIGQLDGGLGQNVINASPSAKARLNDLVEAIQATNGDPQKLLKLKSAITTNKIVNSDDVDASLVNNVIKNAGDYIRNKLEGAIPEAKDYFINQTPLQTLSGNASISLNKANNIPLPFTQGTGVPIPGVGGVKRALTNGLGNALQTGGNLLDSLGSATNNPLGRFATNPANFARGSAIIASNNLRQQPDTEAEDPAMTSETDTFSSTDTMDLPQPSYNPQRQQAIGQAYQILVTPEKMGGMGMNADEAGAYLQNVYGVELPSSKAKKATTAPKITDKTKSFFAAAERAKDAYKILDSGKVGTGKLASAGNIFGQFLGTQDPIQTKYNSALSGANAAARVALAGTALTENEKKNLVDLLPTIWDEPNIAKSKLQEFYATMLSYAQPNLNPESQI